MTVSKSALRLAAVIAAAGLASVTLSTAAFADWHRDRDHRDFHHDRHWHAAPVYVAPAPVYVPPAAVYEPVAPPPFVGFGLDIRVR